MYKLLVNAPSGIQEIIEVTDSGGYFDASRVLWDTRVDGAIPAVTLGGMKRVGNTLEYDAALYASYQTAITKPALKDKVSAKRYAVETAGINFTYRTVPTPVSTSRETRSSMIGAYTKAKELRWVEAPATEKPFKFGDGKFRVATTQEVINIYLAVEAHVDACYVVEKDKLAEIDATGTTDINTGWPATANITATTYFQK